MTNEIKPHKERGKETSCHDIDRIKALERLSQDDFSQRSSGKKPHLPHTEKRSHKEEDITKKKCNTSSRTHYGAIKRVKNKMRELGSPRDVAHKTFQLDFLKSSDANYFRFKVCN